MSGMMLAQQAALSGTVDWANITGSLDASNADVVMPYGTTITASFFNNGYGAIYYIKNGAAAVTYSTPFAVSAGDTLHWEAQTKGTWSTSVTVSRTGGITVDTFNVNLT